MNCRNLRVTPKAIALFFAVALLTTGCDAAQQNTVLDALSNSTTTLLDALIDAAIEALKQDPSVPVTTV